MIFSQGHDRGTVKLTVTVHFISVIACSHRMAFMQRRKKSIKQDLMAGIEGLPLQLMIMVIIAGLGTTVILGWMSGLEAPDSIGDVHSSPGEIILNDEDGDGIYSCSDITVHITVLDRGGNGIEGASVLLEGAGISSGLGQGAVHSMTDSSGRASFEGLELSLTGGPIGFMTVTVAKSGYGPDVNLQVPVICE